MDNLKKTRLTQAGVDISDALGRFMGNENMYEKFLNKFLDDGNFLKLNEALKSGDYGAALEASHTLKGVCGNLSMTALFELLTEQVKDLRAENYDHAKELMGSITQKYEDIIAAIRG